MADFGGFLQICHIRQNFFPRGNSFYFTYSGKMCIVKLLKKNKQIQQVAKMFGEVESLEEDIDTSGKDLAVTRFVT